jgi:hypothetical protein
MLINIQAPDVASLLWEMLKKMPPEEQAVYAPRVNKAASFVEHPNLDGAVLITLGSDGALQPPSTL